MKLKITPDCMKGRFAKEIRKMLFIIVISFSVACVRFPDHPPAQSNTTEIVLISEVEMKVMKPGDSFTCPTTNGVTHWFLISDFALEKINRLQVDSARLKP